MEYLNKYSKIKRLNENLTKDGIYMTDKTYVSGSFTGYLKIILCMIAFVILAIILLFNGYIKTGVLSIICGVFTFIYLNIFHWKTKALVIKNSIDELTK